MTQEKAGIQYRMESDSIGTKEVPADAYYGVQSLRAAENFPMTGMQMHPELIRSLAQLKKACAATNLAAGTLTKTVADAIMQACDLIYSGKFHDQFIVDPIQGGAGTSNNMNANEVIANVAIELLGGKKGDYSIVHPNDHVNCGQSTNDVHPTAGKMTAIAMLKPLMVSLQRLYDSLLAKAKEFDGIIKMGRTQLEDAVPVRLGQEFNAYATAVKRGMDRIAEAEKEMHVINMGGTAIGTGLNADREYYSKITGTLSEITGDTYIQADDMIDATMHIDSFAAVSGALRTCAVAISKIANDLRILSSGPKTGLGEITLPPMQNGSSIMPGKVNPVIPEVVNQAAFLVVGNDVTISMATEGGQMELNAFEPVTFYCLFQSIDVLRNAIDTLVKNCITGIVANEEHCKALLDSSVGTVTALCPHIGYAKSAKLAKEALAKGTPIKKLLLEDGVLTADQLEKVMDPMEMTTPGIAGKDLL